MTARTLQTSANTPEPAQFELFEARELGHSGRLKWSREAEAFIARFFRELREHFEHRLQGEGK